MTTRKVTEIEFEGRKYVIPVEKIVIKGVEQETEDWTSVVTDWHQWARLRAAFKKKEQEDRMRAKIKAKDETATSAAIMEGKEPPPQRPEYVWSDLDRRFNYRARDIPVLALQGELDLRVTRYRALDRWVAQVCSPLAMKIREELDKQLKQYCESIRGSSVPQCKPGRICFVKLPTYAEIDKLMLAAVGQVWLKERAPQLKYRLYEEDKLAGTWVRAECYAWSDCKKYGQFTSVDTGRTFPASWVDVRRAVYRFLTFPAGAYRCFLILSNPRQVTWNVHEKWKWYMQRGTQLKAYVIGHTPDDSLIVRLVKPAEDEVDAIYVKSLNGAPDPSLNLDSPLYDPPESSLARIGVFF